MNDLFCSNTKMCNVTLTLHFVVVHCQDHIQEAITSVPGKQIAINKIVRWQTECHRWAHYERNKIKHHFGTQSSVYAEQNHSSIAAIAGDNNTRTIEKNICDVMERTGLIFDKRQVSKYKYAVDYASDMDKLDATRRRHLESPRQSLDSKPYFLFLQQYNLYTSYNVRNEVRGEVAGALVCHTSNSNDGYFIPDDEVLGKGEECPCSDEWVWGINCRHFIAKRIFRNEPPFCKPNIDNRHLFISTLQRSKVFRHNDSISTSTHSSIDSSAFRCSSPEPSSKHVFSSPSKAGTLSRSITLIKASSLLVMKKSPNVSYQKLIQAGTILAEATSSQSNIHGNAVLTMLVGMADLIKTGDFKSNKYKGTALEMFANQLSGLCGPMVAVEPGMPKLKTGDRHGPPTKYRLGSSKSCAGKKPPGSCSFCCGVGGGEYHKSMSSCTLKESYGTCHVIKKSELAAIGDSM